MGKLKKFIKNPGLVFESLGYRGFLNWIDDETYLKILFKIRMGKKLNLDQPVTFNEKLQWLKLYDRRPEYTMMVDKYEVKKYVGELIGQEYIIPTLGVWDSFDEIDFDTLPDRFVLKCTHDSGGLVICRDKTKLDIEAAKRRIEASLKHNFYYSGREWPYKNVTPRIIAEQYMEDDGKSELTDYKLMCFGGKVRTIFTCTGRHSESGLHITFFDTEWNKLPVERYYPSSKEAIAKPVALQKMICLAEKLSQGIPFVRVDFYEVEKCIYFGELTFYPASGMRGYSPEKWDYKFGGWISLPAKSE